MDHDYISGLSLLGGEPFEYENQKGLLPLIKRVKEKFPNKTIWCYTGYDFDKDIKNKMCSKWSETREMISYLDVLVDGKFEEDKKNISLKFRGSENQRILNVPECLKRNSIVNFDI